MRRAALLVPALTVALVVSGCITPAEVSSAMAAPLPPGGAPFLALASGCDGAAVSILLVYADATLDHVVLDPSFSAGATPTGDGSASRLEGERVARDAAAAGALDLSPYADARGRLRVAHVERVTLDDADLDDLRRRVTLAGFPVLDADYGAGACNETTAAWVDGAYWHVTDHADAAPWTLRHVADGLRELHAA